MRLLRSSRPSAAALLLACLAASAAGAQGFDEGLLLKKQEKFAEAAAVFAALVQRSPRDTAALEQLATLQGWLGRFDQAIQSWSAALAVDPTVVAWQVGRARVLYWKGEHAAARDELERTLSKAPESFDALVLSGDVALAMGDPGAARGFYLRAQKEDPGAAELEKKLARAQPPKLFRLDVGGGLDHYGDWDGGGGSARGAEGGGFAQLGVQASRELSIGGGLEVFHWFGQTDARLNLVSDWRAAGPLLISIRAALTPGNHFLAAWELGAGAEVRVAQPLTLLATVKHLSYPTTEVTALQPGLRLEHQRFSAQLQAGLTLSSPGDPTGSVVGKLGWSFSDAVSGWLGGAYGKEALTTPQATGAPITTFALVTAIFGGASWALDESWGLRLDLTYELREKTYQRASAALGVTYRF